MLEMDKYRAIDYLTRRLIYMEDAWLAMHAEDFPKALKVELDKINNIRSYYSLNPILLADVMAEDMDQTILGGFENIERYFANPEEF